MLECNKYKAGNFFFFYKFNKFLYIFGCPLILEHLRTLPLPPSAPLSLLVVVALLLILLLLTLLTFPPGTIEWTA